MNSAVDLKKYAAQLRQYSWLLAPFLCVMTSVSWEYASVRV